MLRATRYRLVRYTDDGDELYDLQDDPEELVNRIDNPWYAPIKHELTEQLLRRVLGVHVRPNLSAAWPGPGPDVRQLPLVLRHG